MIFYEGIPSFVRTNGRYIYIYMSYIWIPSNIVRVSKCASLVRMYEGKKVAYFTRN